MAAPDARLYSRPMHEYVILDVFTRTPLEGNPVAVFLDGSGLGETTMQRAARELNLSETVFLGPGEPDGADAAVRIFTPNAELPFAGHPVLGTAFVVGERTGRDQVRLATGAGTVPLTLVRESGEIVYGSMEQPIPSPEAFETPAELLRALGLPASELPVEAYRNGPRHVYVQVADVETLAGLAPDLRALAELGDVGVNCFAMADGYVETRVFVPGLGVPEDPATGSAAGPLALHLARHDVIGWDEEIEIHQGTFIGRPSRLRARAQGSPERVERIVVGGGAVVVAEGRYRLR